MAKTGIKPRSVYDIAPFLKEENLLPIYFFTGVDFFTIDSAVKAIEKVAGNLISSEFDKEVINPEKNQSIAGLIDIASAFPFGDGKKLLVVKNFEKFADRKNFTSYVNNPAESTILVATYPQKVTSYKSEPFVSLIEKGFLFEAEELKGEKLLKWLITHSKRSKLIISHENAGALVDMVGEDKSLLEMHIRKFSDFLGENGEITIDTIKTHASSTKEFSIFDLQDAMGKGNKEKALEIVFNLIEKGKEPVYLITMLTKYITTIARSLELAKGTDDNTAARDLGVSWFYYKKCKESTFLRNEARLLNASKALLEADITAKTNMSDQKSLATIMILDMMK